MNGSRAEKMGSMPIGKLLLTFSIPTIIGMLVNGLYNVVDRIFLGQAVSHLAIGGVFLAFPFMILIMAFSMLIGFGGNALSSIELGRGRPENSEKILNNALILLALSGVLLGGIFYYWMEPLLLLFGGSKELLGYATSYLRVILLFTPINQIQFGLNAFTRGEGNPKISMYTMLIGAIVNTILDYFFIVQWGWGIAGAAWATVIGQTCSFLWVIHYFTLGSSTLKIRFPFRLERSLIGPMLKLGSSNFGVQAMSSVITIIYNRQLQFYGGDFGVATMGIIQSVAVLMIMPVIGLNQGTQPIMGFNYGARKYGRVKEVLIKSCLVATVYLVCFWALLEIYPTWFISIFGKKDIQENLLMMVKAMRTNFLMIPFAGAQIICASYFQSTEKPFIGLIMTLSRQAILLIPSIYILGSIYQLQGIWMAAPISDFISFLVTMFFVTWDLKRLEKREHISIV